MLKFCIFFFLLKLHIYYTFISDYRSTNHCLDLIMHSLTTKENDKIIYKFWIQNLSNEKFDNIIKGINQNK